MVFKDYKLCIFSFIINSILKQHIYGPLFIARIRGNFMLYIFHVTERRLSVFEAFVVIKQFSLLFHKYILNYLQKYSVTKHFQPVNYLKCIVKPLRTLNWFFIDKVIL